MVAELVLLQESSVRPLLCFPLRAGRFVLGRSADCDFVIRYQHVSRRHVQIAVANGHATVRDLGSRNGTYVDGRPVRGTTRICPPQRLRLANISFLLSDRLNGDIEVALREADAARYPSIPEEWLQIAYEAIGSFQEEASIEVSVEYLRIQLPEGMGDTLAMQFTAEGAIRPTQ